MKNLILSAQTGDKDALEELWEQTSAFAFTVARRFYPTSSVDSDDFKQCAWLGYFDALQTYNERHNFLTCMEFHIRRECRKALRIYTSRRDPATVSYDVPAPDGEHDLIDLFEDESLPEVDASLLACDLARDIRAAVAELPERERALIEMRWLGAEQLTHDRIAEIMGISGQRVSELEQRAFERLRNDPVLQTYVPRRNASNAFKGGLGRFLTLGVSCTEQEALARINATRRHQDAFSSLIETLAAEGQIDARNEARGG